MALQPEVIGDVEEGAAPSGARDELGLTSEERATWDSMQPGKDAPAAEAPEEAPETPIEGATEAASEPDAEGDDEPGDAPAPAVDPKTGKPPQKHVNYNKHQRLLAQRDTKLAAAEARLREESEQRIKLSERLAILNEALTAPPPVDPVIAQQQAVAENPMLEPTIKVEDDALGAIDQLQRRNAFLMERQ